MGAARTAALCCLLLAWTGWRAASASEGSRQPRLRLAHRELWDLNRTSVFHSPSGYLGLHVMLLDEYQDRLFVGGKNLVYSLSLDRVNENFKEDECANYIRALHRYNRTHLLACGTGAFDPICAFIRVGHQSETFCSQLRRTSSVTKQLAQSL